MQFSMRIQFCCYCVNSIKQGKQISHRHLKVKQANSERPYVEMLGSMFSHVYVYVAPNGGGLPQTRFSLRFVVSCGWRHDLTTHSTNIFYNGYSLAFLKKSVYVGLKNGLKEHILTLF